MVPVKILNAVLALSLAVVFSPSVGQASGPVRASADIYDCTNTDIQLGTAQLKEEKTDEGVKEVRVTMMVKGLTPGKHAVHLHETASCVPCGAAAGHFDPGPNSNTNPDGNHPFHSGDLINIDANARGNAHLNTTTTRVTLSPGPLSLFDRDGSAFIIHVNPDTYCPDGVVGGCAGGARAACGIITLD